MRGGLPWGLSRLGIQHCHGCGLGSIPDPGASTCYSHSPPPKKPTKTKSIAYCSKHHKEIKRVSLSLVSGVSFLRWSHLTWGQKVERCHLCRELRERFPAEEAGCTEAHRLARPQGLGQESSPSGLSGLSGPQGSLSSACGAWAGAGCDKTPSRLPWPPLRCLGWRQRNAERLLLQVT